MYNLFIRHTEYGLCYLLAKNLEGHTIYELKITQTAYFDLREKSIPEISMPANEIEIGHLFASTNIDNA